MKRQLGKDIADVPGAGAAGGLAFGALAFMDAKLIPGVEAVAEAIGLDAELADADWVITGEGRFDEQSLRGKVVSGITKLARKHTVKIAVIAGPPRVEDLFELHGVVGECRQFMGDPIGVVGVIGEHQPRTGLPDQTRQVDISPDKLDERLVGKDEPHTHLSYGRECLVEVTRDEVLELIEQEVGGIDIARGHIRGRAEDLVDRQAADGLGDVQVELTVGTDVENHDATFADEAGHVKAAFDAGEHPPQDAAVEEGGQAVPGGLQQADRFSPLARRISLHMCLSSPGQAGQHGVMFVGAGAEQIPAGGNGEAHGGRGKERGEGPVPQAGHFLHVLAGPGAEHDLHGPPHLKVQVVFGIVEEGIEGQHDVAAGRLNVDQPIPNMLRDISDRWPSN